MYQGTFPQYPWLWLQVRINSNWPAFQQGVEEAAIPSLHVSTSKPFSAALTILCSFLRYHRFSYFLLVFT